MKYVNAYLVERNYGGPEEGGWWYDSGTPIASVPVENDQEADKVKLMLQELFEGHYPTKKTRHSVNGGEDLEIVHEEHFAVAYPTERPHYE